MLGVRRKPTPEAASPGQSGPASRREPVGSAGRTTPRPGGEVEVDVRVIAATHEDLASLVRDGRFREDLFYRLNVVEIELPPLRDRLGDVPLLAEYFFQQLRPRFLKPLEGISRATYVVLQRYAWPGNVRELRNAIEHAMAVARGRGSRPWTCRNTSCGRFGNPPRGAPACLIPRPGRWPFGSSNASTSSDFWLRPRGMSLRPPASRPCDGPVFIKCFGATVSCPVNSGRQIRSVRENGVKPTFPTSQGSEKPNLSGFSGTERLW